jgi:hypothetical protein
VAEQYKGPSNVADVERLIILIQQQNRRAIQTLSSSPGAPATREPGASV